METTNYFQHDYRSRLDKKLLKIRMRHQMAGLGVYWSLVEMLHEHNGIIDMDLEMIAYELQTDEEIIKDVIDICFEYVDGNISSERVIKNLEYRKAKHEESVAKGKLGAEIRWGKSKDTEQSDSSPISNTKGSLYQKYNSSIVNDSKAKAKDKEKDKEKEKDKDKDIDKNTTTVSNSWDNQKSFIENKILDVLINGDSEDTLFRKAKEDFYELGGIDGITEKMGWDVSQKLNWGRKINSLIHSR